MPKKIKRVRPAGAVKLPDHLKENPNTLTFFSESDRTYRYLSDQKTGEAVLKLEKDQWEFDHLLRSFSPYVRKRIEELFLEEELRASRRMNNLPDAALSPGYPYSSERESADLSCFREALNHKLPMSSMDDLVKAFQRFHELETAPCPGQKAGIQEMFDLIQNETQNRYERVLLAFFLYEALRPFEEEDGRFQRFFTAASLYELTDSVLSFRFATILIHQNSRYLKAMKEGRSSAHTGSLNGYFLAMAEILDEGYRKTIADLRALEARIARKESAFASFTKAEKNLYHLLYEASLLSEYGIPNAELIRYGGVTKLTVLHAIRKFRELDLLEDRKVGRFLFHRLKVAALNDL